MANTLTRHLLFILSFLLCISFPSHSSAATAAAATTSSAKDTFRLRLIHRDSPLSPFYNPNATLFDRAELAFRRDTARIHHIRSVLRSHSFKPNANAIQGPVTAPDGQYILKMHIGTPPVEIFLNVDTGSDVVWTQCLPCTKCFSQNSPIYDPSKSSTFETVSCKSTQCLATLEHQCSDTDECLYTEYYGDASHTSGVLAKESFTFESLDVGPPNVTFTGIAFGCSHNSSDSFDESESGIVGFGRGPLSLVNLLGARKFSYCFVPHTDKTVGSQLILGRSAVVGQSSPLIFLNGYEGSFYYLNVTDISVGNETLELPPGTFDPMPDNTGGLIIDSGTWSTYLFPGVVGQIITLMKAQISLPMFKDRFYRLCYKANFNQLLNFPVITFHFAAGLDVPFYPQYTFEFRRPNRVCLAVVDTTGVSDSSILGGWFQQNMNVGYDLEERRIAFAPADCSTFEIGGK